MEEKLWEGEWKSSERSIHYCPLQAATALEEAAKPSKDESEPPGSLESGSQQHITNRERKILLGKEVTMDGKNP